MVNKIHKARQQQKVFEDMPVSAVDETKKLVIETPEKMKYPSSDSSVQDLRSFCAVAFVQIESMQKMLYEMVDWINSESQSPSLTALNQMQVLIENRIKEFSKWMDHIENDGPALYERVKILERKLDELSHKLSEALEEVQE